MLKPHMAVSHFWAHQVIMHSKRLQVLQESDQRFV